ncbi:hypothetical protein NIES2109_64160 (plasmid) [Nostoc sp. HK-01]|nr:hypothetical protein NIES2109_64160 [Nostoc sp. HK-01]
MDMAQERTSIDLSELRERIENARPDPLWKELSLSKKVRILLIERLEQIEQQKTSSTQDKGNA